MLTPDQNMKTFSIDKYIVYPIINLIIPFFYYLNLTPNSITIYNIFFRFFIGYHLIKYKRTDYLMLFAFLISHFLDCCDGAMARKYNMKSKLGGILDETSDKIFWITLFIYALTICKSNRTNFLIIILVMLICAVSNIRCIAYNKCLSIDTISENAILLIIPIFTLMKKC